jgi:transposase
MKQPGRRAAGQCHRRGGSPAGQRRAPGHLSRQGPTGTALGIVRGRPAGTTHDQPRPAYYEQAAERLGGNRACLAIARKLLKRSYHTLRELGEEALTPA